MSDKSNASISKWSSSLPKYYLHGLFFSIITVWFLPLDLVGSWLWAFNPWDPSLLWALFVLAYVFVGFFILIGGVNLALVQGLWSLRVPQTWDLALKQGLALFPILCMTQLPFVLLDILLSSYMVGAPPLTYTWSLAPLLLFALTAIVTPIPNGILCKRLASALSGSSRDDSAGQH